MTSQPESGQAKERYPAYIELFREFFGSRDQHYGDPLDVISLAQRLASPGAFHDDMSSLVRTVLYRENLQVSRAELLDVVLMAIGGPRSEPADPRLEQSEGQLLLFVNIVLLSLRKRPFGEETDVPNNAISTAEENLLEAPPPGKELAVTHQPVEAERTTPTRADKPFSASETHIGETQPSSERMHATASSTLGNEMRMSDLIPDKKENASSPRNDLRSRHLQPLNPELPSSRSSGERFLSRPAALVAAVVLLCVAAVIFWPRHIPLQNRLAAGPGQRDAQGANLSRPGKPSPYGGPSMASADVQKAASPAHDQADPSYSAQAGENSETGAVSSSNEGSQEENAPKAFTPESFSTSPMPNSPREVESAARNSGQPPLARNTFSVQHGGRKGLYTVSSGVMGSNLISAPPPEYPVLAKLTRVEGQVIMQAVVSRNGRVIATHVLQGHHLLRGAAEHAVHSWRYRPYVINGRPTDVETVVFVEFRLRH